jgi:hypothetical protein
MEIMALFDTYNPSNRLVGIEVAKPIKKLRTPTSEEN